MGDSRESVTEFEGALLADIRRWGTCTAYQVRRTFETSRSFEFNGSSGAVYPAIKRLTRRGLIVATASDDRRGTLHLKLSSAGAAALRAWARHVERAVGPGLDPFRTRSSEWLMLPPAQRRAHAGKLARALAGRIAELEEAIESADDTGRPRIELDLALQNSRLAWLDAQDL